MFLFSKKDLLNSEIAHSSRERSPLSKPFIITENFISCRNATAWKPNAEYINQFTAWNIETPTHEEHAVINPREQQGK